ncbi:MAG: hypothetical protein HPY74_06040 [Firmicutes bacterium]|nr:hypothetical protein [Bacillota bacterium]
MKVSSKDLAARLTEVERKLAELEAKVQPDELAKEIAGIIADQLGTCFEGVASAHNTL